MATVERSEKVVAVHRALDAAQVPHAIGGALALAYYGEPRPTVDIDVNFFVPVERAPEVDAALEPVGEIPAHLFFSDDALHEKMARKTRRVPLAGTTIRSCRPSTWSSARRCSTARRTGRHRSDPRRHQPPGHRGRREKSLIHIRWMEAPELRSSLVRYSATSNDRRSGRGSLPAGLVSAPAFRPSCAPSVTPPALSRDPLWRGHQLPIPRTRSAPADRPARNQSSSYSGAADWSATIIIAWLRTRPAGIEGSPAISCWSGASFSAPVTRKRIWRASSRAR
jgi:hypothetical protein